MSAQAWFIGAPASGQGKTTLTAALAAQARAAGKQVRVFKAGPDFLDPQMLARASGAPVFNLDLWMVGARRSRALVEQATRNADLVLVEGAMGLFDGAPSGADLAVALRLPVLLVVDTSAMAQTFGAIVHGLQIWRSDMRVAGVIANRVAGAAHAGLLYDALDDHPATRPLRRGWLARDAEAALPERHLGLLPAQEIADLDRRIAAAARALQWDGAAPQFEAERDVLDCPTVDRVCGTSEAFASGEPMLDGVTIAIARDAAFCFIYPDNLEVLAALGARLVFFSPLADESLPACDALWLPGGYPELHASALAGAERFRADLVRHHAAGGPILAECGGMMCLFDELADADGRFWRGAGLLNGRTRMLPHLAALGLQEVALPEGNLRGHTFHHSICETTLAPIAHGSSPHAAGATEAVYRSARLTASYIHFYFASNPRAVAVLFRP